MRRRDEAGGRPGRPRWTRGLTAAYLGLVLLVTLTPAPGQIAPGGPCLLCGERGLADAILNVALFLPLGLGLRGWVATGSRAVGLCVLLSLSIELLQLALPGRDFSPSDVLFNGLGAAAGAGLAGGRAIWRIRRGASSPGAALALGAAVALVQLAGAWLLGADLPGGRYFAFWIPELDHLAPTDARLSEARLGGAVVPHGWVADAEAVRAALRAGAPLELSAHPGSSVNGTAGLFALYNDRQREVVLVGRDRDDLVLRRSRRSRGFLLDAPDVRLSRFFSGLSPHDSLTLTLSGGGAPGEDRCIEWSVRPAGGGGALPGSLAGRRACGLGVTLGRAWATILYLPVARAVGASRLGWVDAAWTLALALPVGLAWGGPAGLAGAAAALAPLALAPGAGGLLPSPWWLYLSGLAGWLAGAGLRRSARRIPGPPPD